MPADQRPIYLDYHSTTPVLPEVFEAMRPYFTDLFGNASSRSHAFGWTASEAVELARQQVADLLHVPAVGLFFTSGATEGLNFLCKSLPLAMAGKGRHILTTRVEHPAVLDSLAAMETEGFDVTYLPVDGSGQLDPAVFESAIRPDTILAVVMWANNETGVIFPMARLGAICRSAGIPMVSDATQAAGKIPVHPASVGVDAVAVSAHKFYGPKGVGAVYIDPALVRYKPKPLLHGGGHERHLRSGTLNVPGIVGMGRAAALRTEFMTSNAARIGQLRDRLETAILEACPETRINGHFSDRLPTVTNLMVRFTESQAVMSRFRHRLAIASGSACSSADPEPSHVLRAMGLTLSEAKASFRFSLGVPTTPEEIDRAVSIFTAAVEADRAESPLWQMFRKGVDLGDW